MCGGAGAALNENAGKALLEEERYILWCESYAALVGVYFASDADGEFSVGSSGDQGGVFDLERGGCCN